MPAARTEALDLYRDMRRRDRARRWQMAELGQADPNVFAEHCFDIVQQPLHVDFHERITANPYQVLWSPPEHAKTYQLGFIRQMWELGNDTNLHMAHVGATAEIPEGTLVQIAKHIRYNARVAEIFPALRVEAIKRTRTGILALWVARTREHTDRDPSIVALGIDQTIMGRRLHRLLMDDIHDKRNTYTKAQTIKVWSGVDQELMSRVLAEGKVRYIGHPWRREDVGNTLRQKPGWAFHRYDAMCGVDGTPGPPGLWPEETRDPKTGTLYGWPWARLMAKKASTDALTWERMWRCRLPADEAALFPWSYLVACCQRGRGIKLGTRPPEGVPVVTGVDLATGTGSDQTVLTTGYAAGGSKHVLDIRGGFWDEKQLFLGMRDVLRTYPTHAGFLVEDNGMQALLVKTMQRPEIMLAYGLAEAEVNRLRVLGSTTKGPDKQVGIRGLSIDVRNGTLVLPAKPTGEPWEQVEQLMHGLEEYDPDEPLKHTADHVMSLWLCCDMMRRMGMDRTSGPGLS